MRDNREKNIFRFWNADQKLGIVFLDSVNKQERSSVFT